jgi:hypothetical protein
VVTTKLAGYESRQFDTSSIPSEFKEINEPRMSALQSQFHGGRRDDWEVCPMHILRTPVSRFRAKSQLGIE